VSHQFRAVDLR